VVVTVTVKQRNAEGESEQDERHLVTRSLGDL
jgi:hypothetical protein